MTHQKLDEKEPGSVLKLKKWYMIPEGPDFKEGFAFTDPCSTPNEREVELVMKTSYDKLQSELAQEKEAYKALLERESLAAEHNLKLATELLAARSVISIYANKENWFFMGKDEGHCVFDYGHDRDTCEDNYCGKRAREFMKKFGDGNDE